MIIKPRFTRLGLAATALSLAAAAGLQTVPASALQLNQTCQQVSVPVTLSSTDTTTYQVAGQLCSRGSLHGKTMQLLVHGFTYDHRYWDWPEAPQNSYVQAATSAGYATLAIDRLGDGSSSHPTDGNSLNTESEGYVLHQVIQKLHAGSISGTPFNKVVAVGHSLGSAITAYEAGTYHDVSGVILSGYLHDGAPSAINFFTNELQSASQDPAFASSGLNDTYVTTKPGSRAASFFNTSDTDPAIITKDEQIKQTGTTGEITPDTFAQANAATAQITVPVLLTVGDSDSLFCDTSAGLSCASSSAVLAREQSHFSPQAHLQAYVLPGSGHDLNLERNAHNWFSVANSWVCSHIGQ